MILASWRDEKRCRGGFETRPYEGKDAKGAKEKRVMIRFIALFLIAVSLSPVHVIEQTPHVIKYEGDPGKQIKQFNEIFLGR